MADANINSVSMTEKQKVKEITDRLEEGLKELFESEKYKSCLSAMSKFHNYSANNIQLIALQKPDASLVCGYNIRLIIILFAAFCPSIIVEIHSTAWRIVIGLLGCFSLVFGFYKIACKK